MRTAIEQGIEKIKGSSIMSRQSKNDAVRLLKELLEVEKQQIIDAWYEGSNGADGNINNAEDYYQATFKTP